MKMHSLAVLASALLLSHSAQAYTKFIVVRHAEKKDESKDPGLSDEGQKRALALAYMLKDSGVTHIYTSEMRRTQKTAEPLASELRLKATAVGDTAKLVKLLEADTSSGAALVVGHSNTVPEVLKALGATEKVSIGDKEFNRLFILVPQKGSAPVLTTLSY